MKSYFVLVEAETCVTVDAENEQEARDKATQEVANYPNFDSVSATVMSCDDDEPLPECDIPY
jgi:hypothetical protein